MYEQVIENKKREMLHFSSEPFQPEHEDYYIHNFYMVVNFNLSH